ncbi:ribosomal protein S18 acetylase RimI-like enzyme [Bacillus mesophilus]|uniref:GNAT family N-acetyltransferase n=1 Tax=Bacillus mesophilus TaxID=1808955 RepID=A0A6M0Q4U9_9BACI|nr:GNAT family N-acetyltransferase [Bacillus mesophilus]MBM7661060.1 ribosomal protein S18 acetylase RimI-like enzyme [Bacillus mesophilus]NEY71405.1 GNAT family N-acetyltransferase [Bacillus mesophilus]
MEIKLLTPKDADIYRDIRLEALKANPEAFSSSYEEEKEYPLESFENRLKFNHFYTFGAFDESQLVGVVTLILETKNKTKHRANIVAMYVYPDRRKSGIGRMLMNEAINKAKEIKEVEQVYLSVTSGNEPAKKLYNSLGFKVYGVDKNGLKIGDLYFDDDLMVLVL